MPVQALDAALSAANWHPSTPAFAMQNAADRIRRGAAALKERLAQDDAHYRQVAALQRRWMVRRAPPPQDRFYVDLSLRPTLAEPDARTLVDIVRVISLAHQCHAPPCNACASVNQCAAHARNATCRLVCC